MAELSDVSHWFGGDLLLSATGDLARVVSVDRSRQRVLRRLMTADGDYISHLDYGAGLAQQVGENLDLPKVRALIRGEMLKEASVQPIPEPTVQVTPIANGVLASVAYTAAPEQIPAVLSFEASPPDA